MIGLGLAAVMVLGALATAWIARRYERRLAIITTTLEHRVDKRTRALMRTRDAVIFGLAKLAESRDDETGKHLERICKYVELLAQEIADGDGKIDGVPIDILSTTAALHDIGKVGVPDAVLLKPDKLTEEEREIIQEHPGIGGDTLMAIKRRWGEDHFLIAASQIAYGHHERWDGKGYPFGLRGEDIPLSARIVAVADVYDALRSRRQYKEPMPHEQAAEIIITESGKQFDPRVVNAFVAVKERFKAVTNGEENLLVSSKT